MIPGPWKLQLLLPAWALVAARMGGLVMATPLFSSESVPPFVRAMLILAMSVMMLPAALPQVPAGLTWGHVAGGMAGELVIGVLLGLARFFQEAQQIRAAAFHADIDALQAPFCQCGIIVR